jgi:hypothetical protein
MRIFTLALDYDGTIARGDRVDAGIRESIAEARTRGLPRCTSAIRRAHRPRRS